MDNKFVEGYTILWEDSAAIGLADSRRGLGENEGVYYRYVQGESVTQFSLNLLS